MAINKVMRAALKALSDTELDLKSSRKFASLKELDLMKPFYKTIDDKIMNDHHEVPIRIYFPEEEMIIHHGEQGGICPLILFIHGGGWTTESVETYNRVCHYMAKHTRLAVVSIDYRLAPENRFPIPLQDCYAVIKHIFSKQFFLNVDPDQIVLIGDSAGANLVAAVSMMARDTGEFSVKRQILIYPCVYNEYAPGNCPTKSMIENGTEYILTRKDVQEYLKMYKNTEEDYKNPYFSPLIADDFSNLPETLVITAEYDPLRDEGEEYARRLKAAGNKVKAYRMQDALHGYFALSTKYVLVRETYELINQFLENGEYDV
ncbi:MAG: alpha/beta hydrolase [Candidatus Fimimorpha sp.]